MLKRKLHATPIVFATPLKEKRYNKEMEADIKDMTTIGGSYTHQDRSHHTTFRPI